MKRVHPRRWSHLFYNDWCSRWTLMRSIASRLFLFLHFEYALLFFFLIGLALITRKDSYMKIETTRVYLLCLYFHSVGRDVQNWAIRGRVNGASLEDVSNTWHNSSFISFQTVRLHLVRVSRMDWMEVVTFPRRIDIVVERSRFHLLDCFPTAFLPGNVVILMFPTWPVGLGSIGHWRFLRFPHHLFIISLIEAKLKPTRD